MSFFQTPTLKGFSKAFLASLLVHFGILMSVFQILKQPQLFLRPKHSIGSALKTTLLIQAHTSRKRPTPKTQPHTPSRKATQVRPQAKSIDLENETATTATGDPTSTFEVQSSQYRKQISNKIDSQLDYPLALRARSLQGTSMIQIVLSKNGDLISSQIIQSSGHNELDILAKDAIQRASPFPPIPEDWDSFKNKLGRFVLNLPIEFRISHN